MRVTDRLLVLRDEHHRGADEHETLHDEQERRRRCMSSAIATGTAATAHTSTTAPIAVFTTRRGTVAREHRTDARRRRAPDRPRGARNEAPGAPSTGQQQPDRGSGDAEVRSSAGAVCDAAGSVMSRIAWMMLKRLSQMLVTTTVTIAMTNPMTRPALHARPLEREVQCDAESSPRRRRASRPRP